MGLDVSAIIICGEKVKEIEEHVVKTRYNQETGEKYDSKITQRRVVYCSDSKPIDRDNREIDVYNDEVIGIKATGTGSHRHGDYMEIIDIENLKDVKKRYEEITGRKGFIFLVTYMCY